MRLETVRGNLVSLAEEGQFDVIMHGQNCWHGWKKGIVTQIGRSFPAAKKADMATRRGCKKKLGTYSFARVTLPSGKDLVILNCYTQFSYGQGNHLNMTAMREVLALINKDFKGLKVGYPKIGAGQAGGVWKDISAVINAELMDVDHQLVVYGG
ncbi:Phosphatase [Vibrio chagasii]|nr:Phosphatase [Vibrio chagasii]